jgi:hypothetical protein
VDRRRRARLLAFRADAAASRRDARGAQERVQSRDPSSGPVVAFAAGMRKHQSSVQGGREASVRDTPTGPGAPGKRTLAEALPPRAAPAGTVGAAAALPGGLGGQMSRAFGMDFSGVRVHAGSPEAAQVGAQALTRGSEIHFAPGQYDPDSAAGRELIGHELAHVVQQAEGRVSGRPLARGGRVSRDEGLEREADELGARAARGELVRSSPSATAPGAGGEIAQYKLTDELVDKDRGKRFRVYIWGDNAEPIEGTYLYQGGPYTFVFDFGEHGQMEVFHGVEATPVGEGSSKDEKIENKKDDLFMELSDEEGGKEGEKESNEDVLPKGTDVEVKDDDAVLKGKVVSFQDGKYTVHILWDRDGIDVSKSEWIEKYRASQVKPIRQEIIKKVPEGGVSISHFHDKHKGMTGSEYVKSGGNIVITNHGHGSGIYGVKDPSESQKLEAKKHNSNSVESKITMKNPLYLQNEHHGTLFREVSKGLQRAAQYAVSLVIEKSMKPEDAVRAVPELDVLVGKLNLVLAKVSHEEVGVDFVVSALAKFVTAYLQQKGAPVHQPINYVLVPLGFDGLYSDEGQDNAWGTGLVAFSPHDDKLPHRMHEDRQSENN